MYTYRAAILTPWLDAKLHVHHVHLSTTCTYTGFVQKITTVFPGLFKDFSRTKLNFQGPPTMNVISQIVYKMHIPSPS